MNEIQRLFQECQGQRTLREFAALLGVSHSMLGLILSGDRRPGTKLLRALASAFPEKRAQVISLFLPQTVLNSEHMTANVDTDSDLELVPAAAIGEMVGEGEG